MKKFLKILGFTIGGLVLIVLGALAWLSASGLPKSDPGSLELEVTGDSVQLAQGRKVVETVCAACHRAEDATLSGKIFVKEDSGLGVAYAANITRHPHSALSAYSNGELAYLLRTGIKRDGTFAGPFMMFPHVADEDLAGIIAYLRSADTYSTEPRDVTHPAPDWSIVAKALMHFGVFAPIPTDGQPIVAPDPSDAVAYGRYLATGVYECANCHSASFETNNLREPEASEGFLGGGNPLEGPSGKIVYSANLTPHSTGIGDWTYADFEAAVKSGIGKQRRGLSPAMPRFVHLDEKEVRAIWAYLQTVPTLEHNVQALSAQTE